MKSPFRRNRSLRRALDAANAGHNEKALALVNALLADEPDNVEALQLCARLQFQQGDFNAAEITYRHILRLQTSDTDALENLRQTLIQQAFAAREEEHLERAAERLQAALELDPSDAFVHYNLGNVYAEMPNRFLDALECWRQAIVLRPDYIEPHFDLAQVLVYSGRFAEAIPHLEAIVQRRSDWPAPFYLLAVCHAQSAMLDSALAYLKTAVLINPGWGRTAANDENFAPLRGNPEFDSLVETDAFVRFEDLSRAILTPEDLERDAEEFRRLRDEEEENSNDPS